MTKIADYRVVEMLDHGNHGVFYRAEPPARLGLEAPFVALKIMERHSTDAEFRRVANELRVFAAVDSPHVVSILDAGQQDGRLFYAMPWHGDGSLADPAPVSRCLRAVVDAARGAHALHEVGVVHRDIKPANVLLDGGVARLADLGLAQMMRPGMTTTGVGPIGSIEFMEPDVIWGERASRSTDIWSLALTLHRAVCGTGAFGEIPEDNVLESFQHVLHNRPVLDGSLPDAVRPVVERALAADRGDRHPTAADFADDLEAATRSIGSTTDSPGGPS